MKAVNGSDYLTQNMCCYRVIGDPLLEMAHTPRLSPDAAEREAEIQAALTPTRAT